MTHPAPNPVEAFIATLDATRPDAPTACVLWNAHEVTAHLAAALEETAELVEDVLDDHPNRPTRGFDQREAPYRALPDDELRRTLPQQVARAMTALTDRGPDESFEFFGRPFTAAQLRTHAGSEFSLHRWDICGDDLIGDELLSAPEVTSHAVDVLNTLPMLDEAPAKRVSRGGLTNATIAMRSPGQPDVALISSDGGARFTLSDGASLTGDLVLKTDAVNRLLTLWGRFSPNRTISASGDTTLLSAAAETLWPDTASKPPPVGAVLDIATRPRRDISAPEVVESCIARIAEVKVVHGNGRRVTLGERAEFD